MRNSRYMGLLLMLVGAVSLWGQDQKEIRLIIRADDMGSSHAANVACIQAFKEGIVTSVELMVPCPWFLEAVTLLNEHPELDVGIHLTLTSEWTHLKWRPLATVPSLVDEDGYFYPMIWPNANYSKHKTLSSAGWRLGEVEKELRAQIEMALKYVPRCSHISSHMGFGSMSKKIDELLQRLAKEYKFGSYPNPCPLKGVRLLGDLESVEQSVTQAVNVLQTLGPGTWLFVEHPALDTPEMRAIWHTGYTNVASSRNIVTQSLIHPALRKAINERRIKLVSYKEAGLKK
ncbi:MAG: ChbG/HpnK family deacetylase [Phycisphaeraceae bacterium]|nr:ChbG/HpnK family deacetylase [Phycisphaeraceae bacterium]